MFLAGIKKELKLFTRGFRLWGILIAIVGIALMYPGMYKLIEVMADMPSASMGGSIPLPDDEF